MSKHTRVLQVLGLTVAALLPIATAGPGRSVEIPLAEADIFFELNDTDSDLGIHCRLDGEPWRIMTIEDPKGHTILRADLAGSLTMQGLTELFFESGEPGFDELAPEAFFARFPEGEYEMEGVSLEGEELEGEDVLSHVMPAPAEPTVNGVDLPEGCDGPAPSVAEPITIAWPRVTDSHPDIGKRGPIKVLFYQVIVEARGSSPLSFTADLPPNVTAIDLPEGMTSPGEELKVEVLVKLKDGNSTAVEGCVVVR